MIRTVLKWTLRLVLVAVVLAVIFFLSLDSIIRGIVEYKMRAEFKREHLDMRVEIGKFHLGLLDPVVEIKDLRLYNSGEYGGTPFVSIPEIHVEYDRDALKINQIHITLLRFNLGELDIVKGQDGQTNLFAFNLEAPSKKAAAASSSQQLADIKKQTGLDFKGIDCLNVSVGTFKYLDLQDQKNNQEQKIGIENFITTNVVSAADLAGLGLLVGLRSGDFFKPLVVPKNGDGDSSAQDLLKMLGH